MQRSFLFLLFLEGHLHSVAKPAFDGQLYPHTASGLSRYLGLKAQVEAAAFKEESGKGLGAGVLGMGCSPFLVFKLFMLSWPPACCRLTGAELNGDVYEISNI